MGPRLLIIIDVQRGFIRRWTEHVPARVEALQGRYAHVVSEKLGSESIYSINRL